MISRKWLTQLKILFSSVCKLFSPSTLTRKRHSKKKNIIVGWVLKLQKFNVELRKVIKQGRPTFLKSKMWSSHTIHGAGIFYLHEWLILKGNVGIHTIHGCYGNFKNKYGCNCSNILCPKTSNKSSRMHSKNHFHHHSNHHVSGPNRWQALAKPV